MTDAHDSHEPVGETDERFMLTVAADDVLDADAKLWAKLESYLGASRLLGGDPVGAWTLAEVAHAEIVDPETGLPTGQIRSSAVFLRDPAVPSPRTIRAQTETPAGVTDADEAA